MGQKGGRVVDRGRKRERNGVEGVREIGREMMKK